MNDVLRLGNRHWRIHAPFALFVLLLMPLLILLGGWQWHRMDKKSQLIQTVTSLTHQAPQTLARWDDLQRFQRVIVNGHFVPDYQVLLDNRVYQQRAGFEIYSLFMLDTPVMGRKAIWVNRGWRPLTPQRQIPQLNLDQHPYTLQGQLDLPQLWRWRHAPEKLDFPAIIPDINLTMLSRWSAIPAYPWALKLDADQPHALVRLPDNFVQVPPIRHLAYAIQWFGFAAVLLVGFLIFTYHHSAGGIISKKESMVN